MPDITITPQQSEHDVVISTATAQDQRSETLGYIGERNDAGGQGRLLIKFPIADSLNGATIVTAKLVLTVHSDQSSNTRTWRCYRVLLDWWDPSFTTGPNWNKYDDSNSWNTAGCNGSGTDHEATDIGNVSVAANLTNLDEIEIVLDESALQEFIDGVTTDNGFVVGPDTANNDAYRTYLLDAGQYEPRLEITYTLPASDRLVDYEIDIWSSDPQILDRFGEPVPPEEVLPDKWIMVKGISLPGMQVFDDLIEDPSTQYIDEIVYGGSRGVKIRTTQNPTGQTILDRLRGG